MSNEPEILFSEGKIQFWQEGNTLGSTSDPELLTVRFETQIPDEEPFMVIVTEGWSINTAKDLADLLAKVEKAVMDLRKKI